MEPGNLTDNYKALHAGFELAGSILIFSFAGFFLGRALGGEKGSVIGLFIGLLIGILYGTVMLIRKYGHHH